MRVASTKDSREAAEEPAIGAVLWIVASVDRTPVAAPASSSSVVVWVDAADSAVADPASVVVLEAVASAAAIPVPSAFREAVRPGVAVDSDIPVAAAFRGIPVSTSEAAVENPVA